MRVTRLQMDFVEGKPCNLCLVTQGYKGYRKVKMIQVVYNSRDGGDCQMCGKGYNLHSYMYYAHPAIVDYLIDSRPLLICENCAKRESPKKDWKDIYRNAKLRSVERDSK